MIIEPALHMNIIKATVIASCFFVYASSMNFAFQLIEQWTFGVQFIISFDRTCSGPLVYTIFLFLLILTKPIFKISTSIDYIVPNLVFALSLLFIMVGFGEGVDIMATGTFIIINFLSTLSSSVIDNWSNYNLRIFSYYFVIDILLAYLLQIFLIKASRLTYEKYFLTKLKVR
jgi:hypothetical protein